MNTLFVINSFLPASIGVCIMYGIHVPVVGACESCRIISMVETRSLVIHGGSIKDGCITRVEMKMNLHHLYTLIKLDHVYFVYHRIMRVGVLYTAF